VHDPHRGRSRERPGGDREGRPRQPARARPGDVFHSLRCDCGEQLDSALRTIERERCGVLLYLSQEGRGIGAQILTDLGLSSIRLLRTKRVRLGHRLRC
jgi:GTP cyclohydrolase II